jgi:hypothetical protein
MKRWAISARLSKAIRLRVDSYVRQVNPNFPYYPSIMWALEGQALRPGSPAVAIPAGYTLGLIRQDEIVHFTAIPDATFGFIAFRPNEDDLNSTRRLIDDDGEAIVVR